jgi:hypothetical protein
VRRQINNPEIVMENFCHTVCFEQPVVLLVFFFLPSRSLLLFTVTQWYEVQSRRFVNRQMFLSLVLVVSSFQEFCIMIIVKLFYPEC